MEPSKEKYWGFPKTTFYRKRKKCGTIPRDKTRITIGYRKWLSDNNPAFNEVPSIEPGNDPNSHNADVPLIPNQCDYPNGTNNSTPERQPQTCLWPNHEPSNEGEQSFGLTIDKPAVIELCTLARNHNLTDACINDILKLLHNPDVLLNRSQIPKTTRSLETTMGVSKMSMKLGWKCKHCLQFVQKDYNYSNKSNLICCNEKMSFAEDHHIILSVKEVMQHILPSVAHHFVDQTNPFELIKLSMNTDGAPMFKSSNSSLWPLLAAVDNTLAKSRKQNIIMFGIWVGMKRSSKPDFNVFLSPILQELGKFYTETFSWKDKTGNHFQSKLKVNVVLCDSIARPLVQNMSQFNAEYGCSFCYHKQKGHYFTHSSLNQIRLRNQEDLTTDIASAKSSNQPSSRGVKGSSPFAILSYFDMIRGFPPDVLHAVYLGVTKHLTELWINPSNHFLPFYCDMEKQKKMNEKLLLIKPPYRVSRVPRSLDNLKFWKGHEFMMWLLYYSPVVLYDLLESTYYSHWMLLVKGISLLTSNRVDNCDIDRANKLLESFSSQMLDLYGSTHQRFNVHLLLHLGYIVRLHGPLQNYSMTIFESFNMQLKNYVTSSNGVGRQICKRYIRDIAIKNCEKENYNKDVICLDFYDYNPSPDEKEVLKPFDDNEAGFEFFSVVKVGSITLHSMRKSKSKLRDNTHFLKGNGAFQARVFARHKQSKIVFAIGMMHILTKCKSIDLPHCFEAQEGHCVITKVPLKIDVLNKISTAKETIFFKFLNDTEAINE